MDRPFRWNITKREQLGRLVTGERPPLPNAEFLPALRACAARALAFAGDADLLFVGRSPENLFDYLSGVLAACSWAERCALLNISLRLSDPRELRRESGALGRVRELLADHDLAPEQLLRRPRPVAFVDLVYHGSTFHSLATVLTEWAAEQRLDRRALGHKLRFVGITIQTETSPKTWRWHQHAPWSSRFGRLSVKNVALPSWLWSYWGDQQPKVSLANPMKRWDSDLLERPSRYPVQLEALALALFLYDLGCSQDERRVFAEQLARTPALPDRWCRSLILELRQGAAEAG